MSPLFCLLLSEQNKLSLQFFQHCKELMSDYTI